VKSDWLNTMTVMVVGATGAIGRATCDAFLSHGATVVGLGRDSRKLYVLKKSLNAQPDRLHLLHFTGSDQDSWARVLLDTLKISSGIDVFIHTAGQLFPGAFMELTPREIDSIIETNFQSVVTAARIVIPHMVKRRRGHFIVIGSLGGIVPMPFQTMYSATQFALRGFCLALHEEVRHHGVTVSLLSAGPVRSPMLDLEAADERAALAFVNTPKEPGEIAMKVVRLLKSRKREVIFLPTQRLLGILIGASPLAFRVLFPLLTTIGRRGLRRYRHTLLSTGDHYNDRKYGIQVE
jgi:short-subunit dehydrogenase